MLYLNMSRVAFEITHTASISMHLMNIQYKYIESIQNTGTQFQNKHTHTQLVSLSFEIVELLHENLYKSASKQTFTLQISNRA